MSLYTQAFGRSESDTMKSIALLDGGLGQEINTRSSADASHSLWSVKVMQDEPDVVVRVHEEFIKAGAKVLTLNNYTASKPRLARFGMEDKFKQTHQLAINLLGRALDNAATNRSDVNIAGCLMPLAASYVASAALGYEESYDQYCELIEVQINAVDVFLVETISNITEARAAADALASFGQPAYIGLTLNDDLSKTLRSGEPLDEAIDQLGKARAEAIMINCCFPEAVDNVLPTLRDCGLKFGAYANGFTSIEALAPGANVDSLQARKDLNPEAYSAHALRWADAGASIVGGCCEIGPAHIAHLSETLLQGGYATEKLR